MRTAIGEIKIKTIVYCEICKCSAIRKLSEKVYENTPEEIKKAKNKIQEKATREYICRICKSIIL